MTNSEAIKILTDSKAKNEQFLNFAHDMISAGTLESVVNENKAITHAISLLEAEGEGQIKIIPVTGAGDLSDGYHTFNELYHHRAVLFSVICNSNPDKAWKAKMHDDGSMYMNMFIVGIETPDGQATYHYDITPYWDMFKVKEYAFAPKWDGHTPAQAIERIGKIREEAAEQSLKGNIQS